MPTPVPKLTAESLAPKRKEAALVEVLLMTTVPSVVAVSALTVCVVPLRSTVAVSKATKSGEMSRPPLPAPLGMALLAVNRRVPRSRSIADTEELTVFQLDPAPLVPSTSVPSPVLSIRTQNKVEVVKLPLSTVSPGPSIVQDRTAEAAEVMPAKVTDFPATMPLVSVI